MLWAQITWHVSAKGNDENNGRSAATAFRSLQHAAGMVKPGDVVLIGNGDYKNAGNTMEDAVLKIETSGRPDAWITWKALPGTHPEIHPGGWAGILISASYIVIDGITIIGANDSIILLQAQEDTKNKVASGRFNTNGIFVNGRLKGPNEKPHHTIIRNCTVGKCPGGGIIGIESDYFTVEDCMVYENAWFMRYGGSGITTLNNWAYDDKPGYHTIIQRNYCWNNKTMVAWEKIGKLSDGNGIILDVTDQERQGATNMNNDIVLKKDSSVVTAPVVAEKPKRPEWKGHALIANNISAFNGGSGIHTFRTKDVDIINNTTYHNGGIVGYPEMFANASENIVFLNNINVPRLGGRLTSNSNNNKNIRWDYNMHPVADEVYKAPNDIVTDPQFVNTYFDRMVANFRLKKSSAAIDAGVNDKPQAADITRKKRPVGKARDIGAYEQ